VSTALMFHAILLKVLYALHDVYPPPLALYCLATIWAFLPDHWPGLPPLPPALTDATRDLRIVGLV